MSDFYQHDRVVTLHRLGPSDGRLERRLNRISEKTSMALVLPAVGTELDGPALPRIVNELRQVRYLEEVVLSMNRLDAKKFREARTLLDQLPQRHRIIWNDGPRMRRMVGLLQRHGLAEYVPGKGFNVWTALGYLLGRGTVQVMLTHDSDILNYHAGFLSRLAYPVAARPYQFCKAFYARLGDRMYGRVTRLFVTPLIRSLVCVIGPHPHLEFLDHFRYPLSGEFAISAGLAGKLRIPGDWGLEMGMLAEIRRHASPDKICQVDLVDNYEHKHQGISETREGPGLMKMAFDIARSLFVSLEDEGVRLDERRLHKLGPAYLRMARDTVRRCRDDADLNGLDYKVSADQGAVRAFAVSLDRAVRSFLRRKFPAPLLPSWSRMESVRPDIHRLLQEAVEKDNSRD